MSSRTQTSRLNPGESPPPSYGAVLCDDDQPSTPHPTDRPFHGQIIISRGLAVCFVIMLLQTVLIICRSDTLAKFYDLESAANRVSREKSALAAERKLWKLEEGKLEQEREKLRHERELWERARDDRIPQGAFWDVISPAPDCRAYGKREFWATLQNTPEGWNAIDACMNLPVEIHGVTIRRPHRCEPVHGSPHVRGYWMVDWDQPDCRPWWYDYQDAGCTSYKSGRRRIEAQLVGINDKGEQDWWLLCNSTPLIWNLISYTSPTHCQERDWGRKFGMWDVPDDSCL